MENTQTEWAGFTIVRKRDFGKHDQVGFVVIDSLNCNVMPGATWFHSEEHAQKGIAALKIARHIGDETLFWMLMELAK